MSGEGSSEGIFRLADSPSILTATSEPTLNAVATYKPAELARELGYTNEQRPGKVVRDYLRWKYPDHPKYQRWELDEVQADDVRVNVPRKR